MDLHDISYQHLLQSLKSIVEGLLITQVSNVWNVYGGLKRLHTAVENIFKHGCRVFSTDASNQYGEPDCWMFIQGLSWLQPSLATSPTFLLETEDLIPPFHSEIGDKASIWIYKSLESHTLSQKLSWLLSDREHLLSCFEKTAFLCQEKYGEAALICLRAVEQNQPLLLTEINPCLYLTTWNNQTYLKTHRRCSSFPDSQLNSRHNRKVVPEKQLIKQPSDDTHLILRKHKNVETPFKTIAASLQKDKNCDKENKNKNILLPNDVETQSSISKIKYDYKYIKVDKNKTKIRFCCSMPDLHCCDTTNVMRGRSTTITLCCRRKLSDSVWSPENLNNHTIFTSELSNKGSGLNDRNDTSMVDALHTSTKTLNSSSKSKISPSLLKVDYFSVTSSETSTLSDRRLRDKWKATATSTKHMTKVNTVKKCTKTDGRAKINVPAQRIDDRLAVASSSSSSSTDTLHPDIETNKSNDDSVNIKSKSNINETSKSFPYIRPSELKLLTSNSDDLDSSFSANSDSIKLKRRKMIISSSASDYNSWLTHKMHERKDMRKTKKSFIEDGGNSVLPMATGFFPRPVEGQSLMSFLSSGLFSKQSAELDRENAHFSISEAMIAAIEQVKCNRQLSVAEDVAEESDEEINSLKQRIRLRRRQRQEEKGCHLWGTSMISDGKTDTTTTDQSVSPLSSSPGTPSESISTDDVDDLEVDEVKNLSVLKNAGLSVSMASLYSEADLSKHSAPHTATDVALTESIVSAEGVALCLLRQFSEKQLPRASDLEWLVSEQDAPQQLLPLPSSWPISPDEAEDVDMHQATPLRGTMEWAPPRPQVIFTPHPAPTRRVLMAKQNYRCAGCGMKVAEEYSHRFRYCEYLGRYFCTGCHTNQLAFIPGKILTKWDFTRYPVSSFSYRLLDKMMCDPLFCITDLNVELYRRIRQLQRSYELRFQLVYLKDFVLTCRFAQQLQDIFQQEQIYFLTDPDIYSLQDLIRVKNGELILKLRETVCKSIEHVDECQLCQARGFFCELCPSKEVIFPWQLDKVTRCSNCGSCFHISCWKSCPCPRCSRISARKQLSQIEVQ